MASLCPGTSTVLAFELLFKVAPARYLPCTLTAFYFSNKCLAETRYTYPVSYDLPTDFRI